MLSIKKRLSINLNAAITPLIKKYSSLILIEESAENLVIFRDIDDKSGFYFAVAKETYDKSGHIIHFSFCPRNQSSTAPTGTSNKIEEFVKYFERWLESLKYYSEDSILDDQFLREYKKEYFNAFQIMDDDADSAPFNYGQQILLNTYLDNLITEIQLYKDGENNSLIEEIQSDAAILQSNITTQSKNQLMNTMSEIFAKGRKAGLKTANYMINEFIKEVAVKGTDWIFNLAVKHATEIPSYIQHLTFKLLSS